MASVHASTVLLRSSAAALNLVRISLLGASLSLPALSACGQGEPGTSPAGGGSSGANASSGSSSGGSPSGGTAPLGGAASGASSGGVSGSASGGASSTLGGAGNGDAAGTASGGSAGMASGCARTDLLFCEDFENDAADAAPAGAMWTTSFIGPDTPRIVVDASSAHSGSHAVSVTAPLGNFQTFLVYNDAAVLPRASGDFYLRVWVRLSRAMAEHHNAYLILDRMAAPGAGAAVRLGEQANMLSLTVGGDANGTLSNADFSNDQQLGPRFTAETWGCLEGYFNSTNAEIAFWLDDEEIADFHHTDWPADAYDSLRFGFEKYAGPELTIMFDDIAIGASPIGCR